MLLRLLLNLKMMWTGASSWRKIIDASNNPLEIQKNVLKHIIATQAHTDFGKQHQFNQIINIEQFRNNVAIQEFEDLRPYINKQQETSNPALTAEPPVLYALTSGTTGDPKYVPITQTTMDNYKQTQQLVAYAIYQHFPQAYHGQILAITSAAIEGHLDNGTPFGSMSGVIYKSMPAVMRRKYVVPPEVFEIEDQNEKYLQIACHAVAQRNITMIATANPSTMLKLVKVINQNFKTIFDSVARNHSVRARELEDLKETEITIKDIWPNLAVITTWTGGNCRLLIPELRKLITNNTQIIELGYLSSEFRGGLVVDTRTNQQIPCIHETFYEFVEQALWEAGTPQFLNIDELEEGKSYYPLVTTASGLYRYNINDVIKVTGFFNRTPSFEFLQKGKGVINLTGEKLYEAQLIEAIQAVKQQYKVSFAFFMMLGDPHQLIYTIYIETPSINNLQLDDELGKLNIEFAAKLESGRLQPTLIQFVKTGCGDAYKQHCLNQGQRENQFKLVHLQEYSQCTFEFHSWVI